MNDVDIANCQKTIEVVKGKRPSRLMRQYYAEVGDLVNPF